MYSNCFDLLLMLYLGDDDDKSYIWEMSAGAMALVEPIIEVGQIEGAGPGGSTNLERKIIRIQNKNCQRHN